MSERIVEDLLAELDADRTVSDLLGRPKALKTLVEVWRDSHPDSELPVEARWELLIHDLMMVPRRQRQGSPDGRFAPMMTGFDHNTDPPTEVAYPDTVGLSNDDAAIAYYRSRAETTSNPIRKAKYADFVWSAFKQRHEPDAYSFGLMAADAYLDESLLCLTQEAFQRLVEGVDRAAEISVALNNSKLAARVVSAIVKSLDEMTSSVRSFYVLELEDSLLYLDAKYKDLVKPETWENGGTYCDEGILVYTSGEFESPFHARDLMQMASRIACRLGDSAASWAYQVRKAESLENQSKKREKENGVSGSKLVAYTFMEDAMRAYQHLVSLAPSTEEKQRLQRRVERTRPEVRRLLREAERGMKSISVEAEIPREVLEQYIKPLLEVEPEHTLALLAGYDSLLPNMEDLRLQAEEAAEKPSLMSLIGRTTLRDGRKVDEIPSGEGETILFRDNLGLWFQTHAHVLHFIISRLRQEGRFSQESFMAHLERWEFLDENDARFIEVGLERYFADDQISAVHILTPRIEHMMKSAFEQAGIVSIVLPDQRRIREQNFGDFLHRDEVRKALGEDIWHYFYYAFLDERGLNIRNDVAHGWIQPPACHRGLVQIVLFSILLLTRLGRVEESQEETAQAEVAEEETIGATNDD